MNHSNSQTLSVVNYTEIVAQTTVRIQSRSRASKIRSGRSDFFSPSFPLPPSLLVLARPRSSFAPLETDMRARRSAPLSSTTLPCQYIQWITIELGCELRGRGPRGAPGGPGAEGMKGWRDDRCKERRKQKKSLKRKETNQKWMRIKKERIEDQGKTHWFKKIETQQVTVFIFYLDARQVPSVLDHL